MPGAGKSTLGVLLAKALGYDFVDTDLLIQRQANLTLADYLRTHGYAALRGLEAQILDSLSTTETVIATGGSAVYSDTGMRHLQSLGTVIYLRCSLGIINRRISSMSDRGIAAPAHHTLSDVEKERAPLYARYANVSLDVGDQTTEQTLMALLKRLGRIGPTTASP